MPELKLYIVGETRKSMSLLNDLKSTLESALKGDYSLEVVDVLEDPQRAIDDKVFATPTLVKVHPPPVRKVIGDLSSGRDLLAKLGLNPNGA